ncbi:MAG: hypothetical protein U0869_07900 [Chloroflexota bacterium]
MRAAFPMPWRVVLPAVILAAGVAAVPVSAASPGTLDGDIAYVVGDQGDTQVMVVPATGGTPREVWSGTWAAGLAWSPLDHALAFTEARAGGSGVELASHLVDATGTDHVLATGGVGPVGWIEPGLVVTETVDGGLAMRVVDATGATVRDLDLPVGMSIDHARSSPDGSHLAVTLSTSGSDETPTLSLYDAPDWHRRDLPVPATGIAWSPDATTLAVTTDTTVAIVDAGTGAVRDVGAFAAEDRPDFLRWSGDGLRLVIAVRHGQDVDGESSLLSIPASGAGLDFSTPAGDVVELSRVKGSVLGFADGPADGPLAWSSLSTAMDDPKVDSWTTGIIGRDGRTVDTIVAGEGVAVPLGWDATGTSLLVTDSVGLEILDPATDAVTPLVIEPIRPIGVASWWRGWP